MKKIMFSIAIICAELFAVPNHITMPPDAEENTGYAIPYTGHRQSPGIEVGVTNYDWQANGSMGRYVWKTPSGGYSFYWTYRFGGSNANRRAYYNYHLPPSYWLGAVSMDQDQSRMSAPDQMSDGRGLGSAYATVTGGYACRVYLDAAEGAGMFSVITLPGGGSTTCPIWPKPCVDDSDYIYIVASQIGGYSWWTMSTDEGQTWAPWDSSLAGIELNALNFDYGHEVWAQYGDKIALVNNMGDYCFTIVYWETGNQGNTWYYDTIFCLESTPSDSVWGSDTWH